MIKLFAFPLKLSKPNGYWDGLYGEILKDINIKAFHNSFLKLLFSFTGKNIIHIHWPNIIYSSRFQLLVPIKYIINLSVLLIAKARGDRLIWTLHNFLDHEGKDIFFNKSAAHFLVKFANSIIVHTEAGQKYLADHYNRNKNVHIIPHGNYTNFHGPIFHHPDPKLIKYFNIKEHDKVFFAFGSIRPYKNLEQLINIFNCLPNNYKLIIAGKSFFKDYTDNLKNLAENENIIFHLCHINQFDIPKFFSIADFSVFAFKNILTSGSVIMSLSYAVPAIAPAKGDLEYIIKDNVNGFKYKNNQELKALIIKAGKIPAEELKKIKQVVLHNISQINFKDLAAQTKQVYNI